MAVSVFKNRVSVRMLAVYGIDWNDACGDDEPLLTAIEDRWTAEEFVGWWGEKFDLEPLAAFDLKIR